MVDAHRLWKGPILDNHFHLNRKGRFLDAAKDFKNVGGTHLVLVHCPDFASPPTSLQEHRETYADTIVEMDKLNSDRATGYAQELRNWLDHVNAMKDIALKPETASA